MALTLRRGRVAQQKRAKRAVQVHTRLVGSRRWSGPYDGASGALVPILRRKARASFRGLAWGGGLVRRSKQRGL
jgi:hypothetical protein